MFYHSNEQAYGKYTQALFGFILFHVLLSLLKGAELIIHFTHSG
jgi:hypothetical protein